MSNDTIKRIDEALAKVEAARQKDLTQWDALRVALLSARTAAPVNKALCRALIDKACDIEYELLLDCDMTGDIFEEDHSLLYDQLENTEVDGWTCYPSQHEGVLFWSKKNHDCVIYATPDYDGQEGVIDIQAFFTEGDAKSVEPVPYTSRPLTAAEYLELVSPFLRSDPSTWEQPSDVNLGANS